MITTAQNTVLQSSHEGRKKSPVEIVTMSMYKWTTLHIYLNRIYTNISDIMNNTPKQTKSRTSSMYPQTKKTELSTREMDLLDNDKRLTLQGNVKVNRYKTNNRNLDNPKNTKLIVTTTVTLQ